MKNKICLTTIIAESSVAGKFLQKWKEKGKSQLLRKLVHKRTNTSTSQCTFNSMSMAVSRGSCTSVAKRCPLGRGKRGRAQIIVGLSRRGSGHKTGRAKNTQNQFTRTPWLLPLMAMRLPMQPILDPPGRPIGWAAILRTMARSNRLIKLNWANESRANLAWGMHSSQWYALARYNVAGTTRMRVNLSSIALWGIMGGEAMGTCGVANLTTLNDVASTVRSSDA